MAIFEPQKTVIVFDLNGVVLRLSLYRVLCALWRCPGKRFLLYLALNPAFIRDLICGIYRKRVLDDLIEELARGYKHFSAVQETAIQVISAQCPRAAMVQLIEKLHQKNYRLAVLTNIGPKSLALIRLQHPALFDYFSYVAFPTVQAQYRAKPNLDVFVKFKQQMDPEIVQYIFIDDTRKNIEQACQVGMIALSFKNAQTLERHLQKLSIL